MPDFIPQTPPLWQTILASTLAPADPTAIFAPENMINGSPLSGLVCVSIDIGQPNPEYVLGTLAGTTLTILLRNVSPLDPTVSIGPVDFDHRAGAVVKITDFASIQIMKRLLSGEQGFENILKYDAVLPTPDDEDIPSVGNVKEIIQNSSGVYAEDTGTANAYSIILIPPISAYVEGQRFIFKALNTNTGASTIDVDGNGPIAIKKSATIDLSAGDILAGEIYDITFDGVNFQLLGGVGSGSGSGNGGTKVAIDTTQIVVTGDTLEHTLYTVPLPVNIFETNNAVKFSVPFSSYNRNGTDITLRVKLGGTTIGTVVLPTDAGTGVANFLGVITADNSSSAQKNSFQFVSTLNAQAKAEVYSTSAIPTSGIVNLEITAQNAGNTGTITSEEIIVESTNPPTGGLQTIEIDLSSADILALSATPKILVPAPGTGKIINVLGIMTSLSVGGTPYTGGSGVSVRYNGLVTNLVTALNTFTIVNTTDLIRTAHAITPLNDITLGINKAVQLEDGTPYISGNGTLKVFITYNIVTL